MSSIGRIEGKDIEKSKRMAELIKTGLEKLKDKLIEFNREENF